PELKGKPDFFFPEKRVVVFVDGCFWHGCPKCGHVPKTNSAFWRTKIQRNKERDNRTSTLLQEQGFTVIRFWEHELTSSLSACVAKVLSVLESSPQ
ncbi:MAG: very short patch repair endonuclease, partial [Candidatus Thorarchaeota archaeon]